MSKTPRKHSGGRQSAMQEVRTDLAVDWLYGLSVLNCPDLGIPAEEAQFPYIMAVDSSLRVLAVYFPTKSTRGTDYDYRHVKYMYDRLVQKE